MLLNIIIIIAGYLIGSVPPAYIVARIGKGIDIREVDNGNVGAGNVLRTLGLWQGILVGFLDGAKGFVAVWLASALNLPEIWVYATGFAALLGHCFPLYIGFRGGQGVAIVVGIFFYLAPFAAGCTLMVMILLLLAQWRVAMYRIFISTLIASPTLPVFIWLFYHSPHLVLYSLVIIIFIVIRNIAKITNLHSLLSGQKPEK
jgi:glycerol-3-phosphate acyltransferase PlsY